MLFRQLLCVLQTARLFHDCETDEEERMSEKAVLSPQKKWNSSHLEAEGADEGNSKRAQTNGCYHIIRQIERRKWKQQQRHWLKKSWHSGFKQVHTDLVFWRVMWSSSPKNYWIHIQTSTVWPAQNSDELCLRLNLQKVTESLLKYWYLVGMSSNTVWRWS